MRQRDREITTRYTVRERRTQRERERDRQREIERESERERERKDRYGVRVTQETGQERELRHGV